MPETDANVTCEVNLEYLERARREALGEHDLPELPRAAHALPLGIKLPVINEAGRQKKSLGVRLVCIEVSGLEYHFDSLMNFLPMRIYRGIDSAKGRQCLFRGCTIRLWKCGIRGAAGAFAAKKHEMTSNEN